MDDKPTSFLAQKVRISKVVQLRLTQTALLQNDNRVSLNPRKMKKKRQKSGKKNALADEGGVITKRMNKRKRQNTKEEMKKQS